MEQTVFLSLSRCSEGSLQHHFTNGAKIYHSKFGTLETIKLRHILFPRSSWPVRFNSNDIHRPVSTQDFEFITKLNSQIMNLLKSRLSPVWAYARCCND